MSTPTTISVNNNLTASKTSITMRTTNDKTARWVEMEDSLLIQVLFWDHRLDDMLLEISRNLIICHGLVVLSGNENSVDTDRNHGSILVVVLDSNLGFSIRPQPPASPILANLSEASAELGSQNMAQGHQFRGLISGIAKHMALITGTNLFWLLGEMAVDTLSNIRTLLLNVN
ncbi:hypothetical protein OIU84_019416 [Salix udensis]|uniref:Uncharacterized protein n=1 Tax=Salix udensis TaxID=889485 RepID=A0AAD6PK97_9ROSI|nr:hypothetical protein OIU84_019416 [Salix udensis]